MRHAGTTWCANCGTRREVEYDEMADETICKHCREVVVPKAQRLTAYERHKLIEWKRRHRPDASHTR